MCQKPTFFKIFFSGGQVDLLNRYASISSLIEAKSLYWNLSDSFSIFFEWLFRIVWLIYGMQNFWGVVWN